MTEEDILEQMKNIGVNIDSIMNATASCEAVLSGVIAHKDELDPKLFEQMEKSLADVAGAKAMMKAKLADIDKLVKRNGNSNTK